MIRFICMQWRALRAKRGFAVGFFGIVCVATGLWAPQSADAFTYSAIYTFGSVTNDGSQPLAGLAQRGSSNFLWGTTCAGGTNSLGTTYRFDLTNPTSTYMVTYNFGTSSTDGACPAADLDFKVGGGGTFFGTTKSGGSFAFGSVFKIKSNGTFPYAQLASFAGTPDGATPMAQVIHYNSALWGTTGFGGTGTSCCGTVFKLPLPSGPEAPIYSFLNGTGNAFGAYATTGLTRISTVFYGSTQKSNCGHIFNILSTSPYPKTTLYILNPGAGDGCHIQSRLFKRGPKLYGTTGDGGTFGCGTFFEFTYPSGPFTTRYNFKCGPTDGQLPIGDIAYYNNKFYGTTQYGGGTGCGGLGCGTVFEINPAGWTETIYALNPATDGALPVSGVQLIAGSLYGTASMGGSLGNGTIFRVQ